MKNLTTLIMAVALGVIGLGGHRELRELESRVAGLETLLVMRMGEAVDGPASEPSAQAAAPEGVSAEPNTAVAGEAPPFELADEPDSRSYLDELLDLTRP